MLYYLNAMKYFIILLCSLFITAPCYSNAAMPGMWSAGHGGRFIPLFKADSIHLGKIQMQRELVLINLYPGFAAVKGEYRMMNTTDQPITIRVGYPINGKYNAALVDNVMFRDLYNIRALVNDQPANVVKAAEGYDSVYKVIDEMQVDNWYYFTCTFAPKQLTKITVYFLTDNSEAQLSRGYSRDKGNAFAYILETGRAWAGKIERGQVLIRLNEGLSLKDFRGVYPLNTLSGDDTHLRFAFTNLEPDSSNNILLWYHSGKHDDFKFETISTNAEKYFTTLDAFPVNEFEGPGLKKIDKDDFEPHDKAMQWLLWIVIGLLVLGVGVLIFVIYLIIRLVKRKKRQKQP
jgi:hypothetical protein